jgi:TolB protein
MIRISLLGTITCATAIAAAQPAPASNADESALGTIVVDGSAGGQIVLPKLAMIPIAGDGADPAAREIVGRDLDLLGKYDVILEGAALPAGPHAATDALEPKVWRGKGHEFVVRVRRESTPKPSLIGEAWVLAQGDQPLATVREELGSDTRHAAHKLADALTGALTGRAGGFANRLAYVKRVGKGRQVFVSSIDGHGATPYGSPADTALAPTFGPGGELYYTVSKNYAPFQLVKGPAATPVPLSLKGSVLSVAFSRDGSKMAVATMVDEVGKLFTGKADGSDLSPMETEKIPNRPSYGPFDRLAWVAHSGTMRVFSGKYPISPSGFHASSPVFCDTPQGLLIVFTVGVGGGADLVAVEPGGGGVRRLTQGHGANSYPACSPDGRVVAFFSTGRGHKDPGTYALPIAVPTRIRKLSAEVGESLAWSR